MRRRAKLRDDRSNHCRNIAIFGFFKLAAAAILDFKIFKFLMVGTVKKAELRHCAKFHRNYLNCCRDMAIFRFFQDGGRPPSWICDTYWDHPQRAFGGLYHCEKFGLNRCRSFGNMHIFRFHEFGLKTFIHVPKFVF